MAKDNRNASEHARLKAAVQKISRLLEGGYEEPQHLKDDIRMIFDEHHIGTD